MNAERWAQIDQLLDEALARAPEERAAWLSQACHGDADLHAEVASLLAAHDQANAKFLQAPALEIAAQRMAKDNERSLVGKTLGKYQVLSVLGVGGMGEVYLAHDPQLNRKLALKLLPAHFTADAGRVKRFEREAKAASALNHPNIITVYEIGQSAGEHFIAIEYVDGQTLRAKLQQGAQSVKLSLKEALDIAVQTAAALAAAHEAGIVHRDIKPENVMVRRDGYVKVLDFGLAKLTEQRGTDYTTQGGTGALGRTQPGVVMGTASYMSPEQAEGLDVDQRSDVFSLGVLLYELVTGTLPFKGNSPISLLNAILNRAPEPLTTLNPELPGELEHIVNRALEKDRELRYQSAQDLRANLKRLQRELDSSASGSQPSRPLKVSRQSAHGWWLTAAALLLIAAVAFFAWRFFMAAQKPPATDWSKAKYQRLTELAGREGNASISPDGQYIVYGRSINGQWDIFWQRVGGSNPRNLTDHPANDGDPAFSPNGEQIAFYSARNGGGIYVMGATGENPIRVADGGRDPSWSPDGKEIVYSTILANVLSRFTLGGELWVVNVASREKRRLEAGADAVQPSWSPNGHRIAFWGVRDGSKRDIWTIPAQGGTPVPVTNDEFDDANPVWSGDGRWLYFTSNRNGRWGIWRLPIDEQTGIPQDKPEWVPTGDNSLEISLAQNGQRMVYTASRKTNRIFRIAFDAARGAVHGEPLQVTQSERHIVTPDISPDGERVTFYSYGDPVFDLFIVNKDGSGLRQVTNDTAKDRYPRWSPDGQRLAFFTDRTGKYEAWTIHLESGQTQQLTFSQPGQPGFVSPVWASDGKRMAISIRGEGGYLMDLTRAWDAQQLVKLPAPAPNRWFLPFDWSFDGQKLSGITGDAKTEDPGIVIYDLASQQFHRLNKEGNVAHWVHDSRHLVFDLGDKLYLADSQTGAIRELFSIPNTDLDDPVPSADSKWIYYCAYSIDEDVYLITLSE